MIFILDHLEVNFKEDIEDYFLGFVENIGDGNLGIHSGIVIKDIINFHEANKKVHDWIQIVNIID